MSFHKCATHVKVWFPLLFFCCLFAVDAETVCDTRPLLEVTLSTSTLFGQFNEFLLALSIADRVGATLVLPVLNGLGSELCGQSGRCTVGFGVVFNDTSLFSALGQHYCIRQAPSIPLHSASRLEADLLGQVWFADGARDDLRAALVANGGLRVELPPGIGERAAVPHKAWLSYLLIRQRAASALLPSPALAAAASALTDIGVLLNSAVRSGGSFVAKSPTEGSHGATITPRTVQFEDAALDRTRSRHRELREGYLGRPLEPVYPRRCVTLDGSGQAAKQAKSAYELVAVALTHDLAPGTWRDAVVWAALAFSECACVDGSGEIAFAALEVRKVHGFPFVDTACPDCGPQRLTPTQLPVATPSLKPKPLHICIWGFLSSGPWGGGAHFLLALSRAFKRMGHKVCNIDNQKVDAELDRCTPVDLHILVHSLRQIPEQLARSVLPSAAQRGAPGVARVIFRTDGPQTLARGTPAPHEDVALFEYVSRYATTATVFQSEWSLNATLNLGHKPVAPVIIGNAPDPAFYSRLGRRDPAIFWQNKTRVKLCISVWSDGPRKNWPLIEFLDRTLDFSKYSLTLVGRLPPEYKLNNTVHIPPLKQRHLGTLLRKMHIFIAPSYNECFSNAEAQALACGLPVLALRDSSHPEVVGPAGRFFSGPQDVVQALEALVANYHYYAERALPNDIDDVALQFLQAANLA